MISAFPITPESGSPPAIPVFFSRKQALGIVAGVIGLVDSLADDVSDGITINAVAPAVVAGVAAASGGNHGAAVAYAAMKLGLPAHGVPFDDVPGRVVRAAVGDEDSALLEPPVRRRDRRRPRYPPRPLHRARRGSHWR